MGLSRRGSMLLGVIAVFMAVGVLSPVPVYGQKDSVNILARRIYPQSDIGVILAREQQFVQQQQQQFQAKHPAASQALMVAGFVNQMLGPEPLILIDPNVYTELPFDGGNILIFK
jgi:hypothetical protein